MQHLHAFNILLLGKYQYLSRGCCEAGWMDPNVYASGYSQRFMPIDECLNICLQRDGAGYFAYKSSYGCSCYTKEGGCPISSSNNHMELSSYEIIGIKGNLSKS